MPLRYLLLPAALLLGGYLLHSHSGRALLQQAGLVQPLPTLVYRWQSPAGHWHYSDQRPAHLPAQLLVLAPTTSLPPPRPAAPASRNAADAGAVIDTGRITSPAEARALAEDYFRRLQSQADTP